MQRKLLWVVLCLIILGCAVTRVVTAQATPSPSWTRISWVTQTVEVAPGDVGELVFNYIVGPNSVAENIACACHSGFNGGAWEVCSNPAYFTVVRDAIGATIPLRQWASWQECVGGTVTWPDGSTTPVPAAAVGVAPVIPLGDVPNGTTLRVSLRVKAH